MPRWIRSLSFFLFGLLLHLNTIGAQGTVVTNPSGCGLGVAIPDNNCTPNGTIYQPKMVEIVEDSTPGLLGQDVFLSEVRIIIDHTWTNDVNLTLVSPSGIQVVLTSNNGGGDNNYGNPEDLSCSQFTTFSVGGCTPISEGLAPFLEEPYIPQDHFYLFNDGITPANGHWLLLLCDDAAGDTGSLEYVELVFEPITCLPISQVLVTNIDTTSVELAWEPSDFCGTTIIEFGPPGFIPGTDSMANEGLLQVFDCTPITLSGLLPDTGYELYVRRYCALTGHFSPNSCPVNFVTGCQPPAVSVWENFDSQGSCVGNCLVDCDVSGIWKNARNDDMDWIVWSGSTGTPGTGPSDDVSGGGKYIYIETSGCTSDMDAVLYSSCIQLDKQGTDTCHLSFNYHMFGFTVGSLSLEVSDDGGFTWHQLWGKSGNQGDGWLKTFIGLGDYEDGAILQFRFIGRKTSGLKGDIALDDIVIYGSQVAGDPVVVYYFDGDEDGFGDDGNYVLSCTANPPSNYVITPGDCNDSDNAIHPGALEIPCDGIDNNCNLAVVDDDIILPAPPATGDTICSGEIPVLCATPVEGNFILWYDAIQTDSVVGFGNCFMPTDLPLNNSPVPVEFTYLVGQTLDFNCFTFDLAEVVVVINPNPDVSTSDMPEICPSESFNLASLNLLDANFTGGQVSFFTALPAIPENLIDPPVVSPSVTTDYYFLMTSPDGCTDEGVVTVVVKPGPQLSFFPSDSFSLCKEATGIISVEAAGGTGAYSYFWSTGSSMSQLEVEADFLAGTEDVYFVTVTDEEGCFTTDSVKVTTTNSIDSVRVFVSDVSECMGTDGSITIIPLNGTSPFHFEWTGSNGLSGTLTGVSDTAFITGLPQGGYHIEITDSSAAMCSFNLRNVIVQGPGVIIMPPGIDDVSCFGAQDGQICLNIQGNGAIDYLWNTGETTLCVDGLSGGAYSVTITSGECETVLNQILVDEPDSLFVGYNIVSPTCAGLSNGSISVTPFGGTPAYQYHWSTNAISPYILNKPVGTYSLTVTDFHGCTFMDEIELPGPEPLNIQLDSLKNMSCNGVKDGFIHVTGQGGTPPYKYKWSTGSTAPVLLNLAAGVYQVTVTDLNQCQAATSYTIVNPGILELGIVEITQPDCLGDTTGQVELYGIGGTPPYHFFGPEGAMAGNALGNLGVGEYEFYVTDGFGCESESVFLSLTSLATLDFGISVETPLCVGPSTGSIQLDPDGIGPFSYLWHETGDTTSMVGQLTTGIYSVQVMDGEGCLYDTSIVMAAPQVFDLDFSISGPSCFEVDDAIISVLVLNSGIPPFQSIWNDGAVENNRTDLAPGDYQLTISDVNGCTFVSDTLNITYPELLRLEVEEVGLPVCNGESTAYIETNIFGGTEPFSINWLGTGLVTEDISDLPADDYRIIVFDANGCAIDTTIIINEPGLLVPGIEILQGELCTPATGDTLMAFATGGTMPYTFTWSEGSQGPILTGVEPGNYSFTVEDANGCSAVIEDVKLKEKTGAIILDTFMVNGISCSGETDANMTAVISNGSGDYLYHFTPTYILHTSADSVTKLNLTHSAVYSVTITDLGSGCTVASDEVSIQAPLPLTVSQDSFDLAICFGGNDGGLYITVSGGTPEYSFAWNDQDGMLVGEEEDLENIPAGIYSVLVTDAHGCTVLVTDSSVVHQNPLIVNDSTIITNVKCRGDSTGMIDINVSGGVPPFTYKWSYGGVTSEDLSGVPFGSYTVTVTDSDTCRAIFPFFFVGQPPTAIEVENQVLQPPSCFGYQDGSIGVNIIGGGFPYDYYWNYNGEIIPGQVSDVIENLEAGIYELVVTDTMDCQEHFEFDLAEPEILEITLIGMPPNPPLNEGSVMASVSGGTPGYTYFWNTGDTTMSIGVSEVNTYVVTVVDANGCSLSGSILLVPTTEIFSPLQRFNLYPNPAGHEIFVDLTLKTTGEVRLALFDLLGTMVAMQSVENFSEGKLELNITPLPEGIYFLKCFVDGALVKVREVGVIR